MPALEPFDLAVFKELTEVQVEPFQDSVADETGGLINPPKAKADV